METYLNNWKRLANLEERGYRNFFLSSSDEFRMKNSLKPEDENKKSESGDSGTGCVTIHCIVQTISTLEDLNSTNCPKCEDKNKMDEEEEEDIRDCECKKNELSDCVAVPEDTHLRDLVKTVLVKLGYPPSASSFATGFIVIRNWKPLSLETVCPELNKTVGEILGEIAPIASLKIQFFRPKMSILQKIKDNLLNFLIKANQSFLQDSGCPFDMGTLTKFCDSDDNLKKQKLEEPSEDLQSKFDSWLKHHQEIKKELEKGKRQCQSILFPQNNNLLNGEPKNVGLPIQSNESSKSVPGEKFFKECSGKNNTQCSKESSSFTAIERSRNFNLPKTRVRTSFDPEFELPKLHKWFLDNPHPSRQQIYEYVAELNSLDSRKGRKQLDVNNVVYWFKNARAAQKRSECRKLSGNPSSGINTNVLKIPLGKTTGVTSDDQRSVSDDEGSVTSESGDDYRNENSRCLQVVGKWNSNGQGEAVLEMQIGSRKADVHTSSVHLKKENVSKDEECSRSEMLSTDEDSVDPIKVTPETDQKNGPSGPSEKIFTQRENQPIKNSNRETNNKGESECYGVNENQSKEEIRKDEVTSSKIQVKSSFALYKENNGVNHNAFLSTYKSGFSVPPNPILGHSFICMSQYVNSKPNHLPLSTEERRKRNRTFIDPVTEVPRLEQWFRLNTHPSHSLIARYTEELNNMPYRRKFPKLEAKNVQFWFKNRRAKNKRLNHIENNNNNSNNNNNNNNN